MVSVPLAATIGVLGGIIWVENHLHPEKNGSTTDILAVMALVLFMILLNHFCFNVPNRLRREAAEAYAEAKPPLVLPVRYTRDFSKGRMFALNIDGALVGLDIPRGEFKGVPRPSKPPTLEYTWRPVFLVHGALLRIVPVAPVFYCKDPDNFVWSVGPGPNRVQEDVL